MSRKRKSEAYGDDDEPVARPNKVPRFQPPDLALRSRHAFVSESKGAVGSDRQVPKDPRRERKKEKEKKEKKETKEDQTFEPFDEKGGRVTREERRLGKEK